MQLICLVSSSQLIYSWLVPLKDEKGTSIANAFQKIISEERKQNKIWVDQDSEFYNILNQ